MKTTTRAIALCVAVLMFGSALVACTKQDAPQAGAKAEQAMPPMTVDVQVIELGELPMGGTFSGRVLAAETSEVRPQVSGIIDEILFQEGAMVQAGQPLYRINADSYTNSVMAAEASLNQARANVGTAKAGVVNHQAVLEQARADLTRLKGLLEVEAISQQSYDQAVTKVRTSEASVEQARATLASAEATVRSAEAGLSASRLDLNRTIVRAPISGRSGISSVTKGALVASGQAASLVTISRLDPVFVDINQSTSEILKLRQQFATGQASEGSAEVQLVLEDGTTYPIVGRLAVANTQVDEATGSVKLRAVFPNPHGVLLPNMYVNARLAQSMVQNAVLLPQSAIMRTPQGKTQVYIVNQDKKIEVREIKTEGTVDGKWLVTEGLKTGDHVVVMGGAKVKPDQVVEMKIVNALANDSSAKAGQQGQPPQANEQAGQGTVLANPQNNQANAQAESQAQPPEGQPESEPAPTDNNQDTGLKNPNNQAPSPSQGTQTPPKAEAQQPSSDEQEAIAAAD